MILIHLFNGSFCARTRLIIITVGITFLATIGICVLAGAIGSAQTERRYMRHCQDAGVPEWRCAAMLRGGNLR
jgi:hypothetical protein